MGRHSCSKRFNSPDLVHLLIQKPRSRSLDAQLLRFSNVPEGQPPTLVGSEDAVPLMQQCPMNHG